jgi:hypothetical protein
MHKQISSVLKSRVVLSHTGWRKALHEVFTSTTQCMPLYAMCTFNDQKADGSHIVAASLQ